MATVNRLKERWARGDSVIGVWSLIPEGVVGEVVARAGFDFVLIDHQHSAHDHRSSVQMLQVAELGDSVPVVRVPWNEPGSIGQMLDAGAEAIIIPMVNSAAEAEAAVRACRYPPEGARSYGPLIASLRKADYMATANEDIACIPMVETVEAVEALDEILALKGIDAIYVGPSDLSISLGLSPRGSDQDPLFVETLERILAACAAREIPVGTHASPASVERYLEMGFRMLTTATDIGALGDGLARVLGESS